MQLKRLSATLLAAVLAASAWAEAPAMTEGEVRKVDMSAGKITLKHGEIKNLEMPPMTMIFTAKDKSLLEKVKVGDKVKFHAEKEAGRYVVTALEPQS